MDCPSKDRICFNCKNEITEFYDFVVCENCGCHYGYKLAMPFNSSRRKRSVYQRKYHLDNTLRNLNVKFKDKEKITKLFNEIMNILSKKNMCRSIRFSYIFDKINNILKTNIPVEPIKTKNIRKKYDRIWTNDVEPILEKKISKYNI